MLPIMHTAAFTCLGTHKLHLICIGLQVLGQAGKAPLALLAADFVRLGDHYQGGVSLGVEQLQHPLILL